MQNEFSQDGVASLAFLASLVAVTLERARAETDKKATVSKVSTEVGPFSEKNLPSWCSGSCPALVVLHTPQGKLRGCRQELDGQVTWTRLSYLKGCPEKVGPAAMNDQGWPDW